MAKSEREELRWLPDAEAHDYPAAQSFLTLLYGKARVDQLVSELKRAPVTTFKSKDIFRASMLPVLQPTNVHVKKDTKKLKAGKALSPLLLVRDEAHGKVIIADGYHRLCAVYLFDEDAGISCKIV